MSSTLNYLLLMYDVLSVFAWRVVNIGCAHVDWLWLLDRFQKYFFLFSELRLIINFKLNLLFSIGI